MKELDVLLTRYVDDRFAIAPPAEQQAFERLLEAQDPLIYAYCLGQAPVPADLGDLIERITTTGTGAAGPGTAGPGTAGPGAAGPAAGSGLRC
jgi:antitoxin CptB